MNIHDTSGNRKYVFIGGNGFVYAIKTRDGQVAWERELKPKWLKTGSSFVSLMEDGDFLYAFAYGTLYKLSKADGRILMSGSEIKKLKHNAGVFSVDPAASTGGSVAMTSCGDSDSGSSSDGGDSGGDGGGGGD